MKIRSNILVVLGLLALMTMRPVEAWSSQAELTISGNPPWKMSADQIDSLQKDEVHLAIGQVRISRGAESLEADRVRYHHASHTAEAPRQRGFHHQRAENRMRARRAQP